MATLTLNSVTYRYEGTNRPVLKEVTAEFASGKVYVIVGKSGSGKSTLFSLISGLDICSSGEIIYQGTSLRELDRDDYRAKGIDVVFQGFNLLTNYTATENILLSMHISCSRVRLCPARKGGHRQGKGGP